MNKQLGCKVHINNKYHNYNHVPDHDPDIDHDSDIGPNPDNDLGPGVLILANDVDRA